MDDEQQRAQHEREDTLYMHTVQLATLRVVYNILFNMMIDDSMRKDMTTAMNAIHRQIMRLERAIGVGD